MNIYPFITLVVLHWHIIWSDGQNTFYSSVVTSFEGWKLFKIQSVCNNGG